MQLYRKYSFITKSQSNKKTGLRYFEIDQLGNLNADDDSPRLRFAGRPSLRLRRKEGKDGLIKNASLLHAMTRF